jgi:hypothetical protein
MVVIKNIFIASDRRFNIPVIGDVAERADDPAICSDGISIVNGVDDSAQVGYLRSLHESGV